MADFQEDLRKDIKDGLHDVGFTVENLADVDIRTSVRGGVIRQLDGNVSGEEHSAETYHWTAKAEHTGAKSGLPPTNQEVPIEGMTIVFSREEGGPQFLRVIDWASVHARLGFLLETRPLAPPESDASYPGGLEP